MKAQAIQQYGKRTIPWLLKKATSVFNEYIRLRDQDAKQLFFYCISCGQPKELKQLQAGHYLSAGHHASVRFDEDNVHGQCIKCNMHLSANQAHYRLGLVNKIGIERVEIIERKGRQISKWDRYSLIDVIETYSRKVKKIKYDHKL